MPKPKFYFDVQQHIFDKDNPYNYQTSEKWLSLRADKLTASYADGLIAAGKHPSGLGTKILEVLNKRIMECYSGWRDDASMSISGQEAVMRGICLEQEAADWYSRKTGRELVPCGFVSRGQYLGCSPDRICVDMSDKRRLVQIKIPMPHNFTKEIMAEGASHVPQCKMELFVCDFHVNDLVIYSPELKTGYIREIERDQDFDRNLLSRMRFAVRYQEEAHEKIKRLLARDTSIS